jgi:hypothetical protein
MDARFRKSPGHGTTLATNYTKGGHREVHLKPNLLLLMHTHGAFQQAVRCARIKETYPPKRAPLLIIIARGLLGESTVARHLI